jgi:hypothetical protein
MLENIIIILLFVGSLFYLMRRSGFLGAEKKGCTSSPHCKNCQITDFESINSISKT